MIKITSRYYGFLGQNPCVGVVYLEGTYPSVKKSKVEYPLPLDLDAIEKEEPTVGWALLKLESEWKGEVPA